MQHCDLSSMNNISIAYDSTLANRKNNVTFIHLLGFPGLHTFKVLFFILLLIVYGLIILGNTLIIVLVLISTNLQTPMYIFLSQLSVMDVILATDILPNMLNIALYEEGSMFLTSCIIQFCVFGSLECSECLLFAVMSLDRYLAICNPLHYSSIVNEHFCLKSIASTWMSGFIILLVNSISICKLYFCGPNIIDHFFCDFGPLVGLSCSDTLIIETQTLVLCFFIVACPFLVIVISYLLIISTILKINTVQGRQKAFFTCSSHLTAVSIYYGTLISVYVVPTKGQLVILGKMLSLLYTVVTPLLNPAIYTIRNKDFMEAFDKLKAFTV
ncbi:olfactory receptor 11A1-like [Gastrophryne carolinensis]